MRLPMIRAALLVLALASQRLVQAAALLSVPHATDALGSTRAAEIAMLATLIKNEPRTFTVGNQSFPFYDGPKPLPGSLAFQIRMEEIAKLREFSSDLPAFMAPLVVPRLATFTTLPATAALYELATARVERPISVDNSDAAFGAQRLSIKAMKLRLVNTNEFAYATFQLSGTQLTQRCGRGVTWRTIRTRKNLFVEDFSDAAQWNDPETVETKHVPNVVGLFCYNRISKQLLPVEIRFPDTGIAYSPLDTEDEWTLAKIALNAASVSFHQMFHMADTHAVTIPIRVELYRNMAAAHPVRALLTHHTFMDFGLEMLLAVVLLAPNTPMDRTFGWGATGCVRFLHDTMTTSTSIANDLPTDLARRGLNGIPTHKYARYGTNLYTAISSFVRSYVDTYYPCDASVRNDFELQNWASASAKVPHLKGFPARIQTRTRLVKLLSHLVFQSAVKHHAMNGAATWHMLSVPYSPSALWKKMPTRKLAPGETLDLMAYSVPVSHVMDAVGLAALFYRPAPVSETLPVAYRKAPFANETCLQPAIARFEKAMAKIDALIVTSERGETNPFHLMRPTVLPFYSWV